MNTCRGTCIRGEANGILSYTYIHMYALVTVDGTYTSLSLWNIYFHLLKQSLPPHLPPRNDCACYQTCNNKAAPACIIQALNYELQKGSEKTDLSPGLNFACRASWISVTLFCTRVVWCKRLVHILYNHSLLTVKSRGIRFFPLAKPFWEEHPGSFIFLFSSSTSLFNTSCSPWEAMDIKVLRN